MKTSFDFVRLPFLVDGGVDRTLHVGRRRIFFSSSAFIRLSVRPGASTARSVFEQWKNVIPSHTAFLRSDRPIHNVCSIFLIFYSTSGASEYGLLPSQRTITHHRYEFVLDLFSEKRWATVEPLVSHSAISRCGVGGAADVGLRYICAANIDG